MCRGGRQATFLSVAHAEIGALLRPDRCERASAAAAARIRTVACDGHRRGGRPVQTNHGGATRQPLRGARVRRTLVAVAADSPRGASQRFAKRHRPCGKRSHRKGARFAWFPRPPRGLGHSPARRGAATRKAKPALCAGRFSDPPAGLYHLRPFVRDRCSCQEVKNMAPRRNRSPSPNPSPRGRRSSPPTSGTSRILFKSDAEWEAAFKKWEKQIPGYEKFKGHLGDSAEMLAACLRFDAAMDRTGERLGVYAYLKTTEDQGNSEYQRHEGPLPARRHQGGRGGELDPAGDPGDPAERDVEQFLKTPELEEWQLALERILRYRPHTLGEEGGAPAGDAGADERGGQPDLPAAQRRRPEVGDDPNERGERVELGHSSFSAFLHSPSRKVRKEAFHKYYAQYDAHKNTIAAAAQRVGAARRVLRPGPRTTTARWRRRCSTTTCRCRSTTT